MYQMQPKFVFCLLSLPHANADSERLFSQMNLMKTKCRNRLLVDTMNGTLLSHQKMKRGGGTASCTVSKDMFNRMTTKNLYSRIESDSDDD
jgi:hypothetical protein